VSRFAEHVFHVLAHVPGNAPASVFDPAYVAFVAKHAGPADSRPLGEDALVLSRGAKTHETLARLQMLAWVFEGESRAPEDRNLEELTDVDDRSALAVVTRADVMPLAEVLRASAELEAPVYDALPRARLDRTELDRALAEIAPAAPFLRECTVECVRPLRLRGRVRGRRIWVGEPSEDLGPTTEHAAFQAAHEATVAEVSSLAREHGVAHDHHALEHASLVLFAERAESAGLAARHARWLSHLARVPVLDRARVPATYRELLARAPTLASSKG
jgi:hypothetical protein